MFCYQSRITKLLLSYEAQIWIQDKIWDKAGSYFWVFVEVGTVCLQPRNVIWIGPDWLSTDSSFEAATEDIGGILAGEWKRDGWEEVVTKGGEGEVGVGCSEEKDEVLMAASG